jgi:hypothetical protein
VRIHPVARWVPCLFLAMMTWIVGPAAARDRAAPQSRTAAHACEDLSAYWPLWRALAVGNGTSDQSQFKPLFPLIEVIEALRAVPLTKPLPAEFADQMEYYRPQNYYAVDAWAHAVPYAKAAAVYEAGDLPEAIRQFDAIVAGGDPKKPAIFNSPFRAAAAYTAARAAFRLGNFEDGAVRIDRILADPSLSEFWAAAWMLIPRIRYGTDAAPLAAAEMVAISRLMTIPTTVMCGEPTNGVFGKVVLEAAREDSWLPETGSGEFLKPGLDYVRADPIIMLLATQEPAVARERWQATRNPLWALQLGGTEQDLSAMSDAIGVVRTWPDLTDRAKASLVWELAATRAHSLLISGKPTEALAALAEPTPQERQIVEADPPDRVRDAFDALLNNNIRYLVARHEMARARQWAIAAGTALRWPIAAPLKPLLAESLDELYRHSVLGITPVDGATTLGPWRRLLDGWSSERLIAFSRRPDVAPEDRRAMVGAAWIRAFALRRWGDVYAWLPDLRTAFPRLGPDIDLIEGAWLPINKRHLVTRMVLRSPGLVALPSWGRPPGDAGQAEILNDVHRPWDVLAFDPYHASDGNWWCSPSPSAVLDQDWEAILEPLREDIREAESQQAAPTPTTPTDETDWRAIQAARNAAYAADIPLMRDVDRKELDALAAAGSASERLAEDAVEWGRHRDWLAGWFSSDEYLPETLHLAVRATRFGCRRPPDNSPWSRTAFKMLHERYPASEWTKGTPYWFGVLMAP